MQVTIFGATGKTGMQLVRHCLANGYKVKAFARNTSTLIDSDLRNENLVAVKGYVFEQKDIAAALEGSEFVLSALGGSFDGNDRSRSIGIRNISQGMKDAGINKIMVVGNLGVMPGKEGNNYHLEDEDFDDSFIPVSREHAAAYETLLSSGLEFQMVCAPNLLEHDADEKYETFLQIPSGLNEVFTGNLAHYMVNSINKPFVNNRVGIRNSR